MDYTPDYEAIIADQQVLIRTLWNLLDDIEQNDNVPPWVRERVREIVAGTKRHAVDMAVCACGHLMRDHDTRGCMYLGCKPICGPDSPP